MTAYAPSPPPARPRPGRRPPQSALAALAAAAMALAGCARHDALHHAIAHVAQVVADNAITTHDDVDAWLGPFYHRHGDDPMWCDPRGPTSDAHDALAALDVLADHGLDPRTFATRHLRSEIDTLISRRDRARDRAERPDPTHLAHLDIAITRAVARAAVALACGRVPPEGLDAHWLLPERRARVLREFSAHMIHGVDAALLASFAPRDSEYARLQSAYARMRHEADRGGGAPRLETLAMNLERRRWLAFDRPGPRLEVNVADQTMRWVDSTGATRTFTVVVGDSLHPTPMFSDAVSWLDLRPDWRLSRRIVAEDVAPAYRRDHQWLEKHDMEVLRMDRRPMVVVPPESVTWDSVTATRFPFLVRQRPGKLNPLGVVKFGCPNPFDVYLHDTNQRYLFRRPRRALSHGCVRVAQPESLAARLLAPTRWGSRDSLRALFADTTGRHIGLTRKVPVDFLYWTAWVDATGKLELRDDLYGLDARMAAYLRTNRRSRFVLNPDFDWRGELLGLHTAGP